MDSLPPWVGYRFTSNIHATIPESTEPSEQTLPTPFTVCIVGANRDIGAKTAEAFAEAGASGLILTSRSGSSLEDTITTCKSVAKNADLRITAVQLEAGSEQDAENLAAEIRSKHGRLDVLINNIGVVSEDPSGWGPLESATLATVKSTMDVNYITKFLTIKHLIPVLRESPNSAKAVINISAMAAHFAGSGPWSCNISQLASNRLIEAVADRYGGEDILAYAVHPGGVGTKTKHPPGMPERMIALLKDDPKLCGAFLIWLVKERRPWLSGRYLSVNWDVADLIRQQDEIVQNDKLKMRMVV